MSRGPAAGDEGQDKSLSEDYYAVLNVSREASAEELKASFRRLCVLYHPDKHQREDLKAAALAIFPRVQKAYAVLSDEQQRAVYDMYGVAGLEAGRELAPYHNHAGEMRAEYAMRRREQEHAQELAAASPQGRMSVTIDAAPLFRPVDTELVRRAYCCACCCACREDACHGTEMGGAWSSTFLLVHLPGFQTDRPHARAPTQPISLQV